MLKKLFSLCLFGFILFHIGTSDHLQLTASGKTEQPSCQFTHAGELTELLHVSMSTEEVVSILGSDYAEGKSMMTNERMWRYDLCTNNYERIPFLDDAVDIEALQNKQCQYIIFIAFTENNMVDHYSMYYMDADGYIREYVQFADGSEKDHRINPF